MFQQKRQVMYLAVGIALLLTVAKSLSSIHTHSMGILASALDSLMDFLVSSMNLFALIKAGKPPDKGHPYGHGKVEHIAGLFQCFIMSLSIFYLVVESVKRFFVGTYLTDYGVGFGVMSFSMLVSLILVFRLNQTAKKSQSIILETESLHYSSDILTNGGVIIALLLARWTGQVVWDLVISLVIAGYLVVNIYRILKRAINELMDHEPSLEIQEAIKSYVVQHNPKIIDIHDFRARAVGERIFADFHITIKDETVFKRAHDLTESLIAALHEKFPNLEVNIHYDPHGAAEPHRPELPE